MARNRRTVVVGTALALSAAAIVVAALMITWVTPSPGGASAVGALQENHVPQALSTAEASIAADALPLARLVGQGAERDAGPTPAEVAAAAAMALAGSPLTRAAVATAIQIPTLGVSAPVVTLGVAPGGQLAVPADGQTAGWYQFTAAPGTPGNAVFAGHVDWAGAAGIFAHIADLRPGAVIRVWTGNSVVTYRVDRTYAVTVDGASLAGILNDGGDAETLTLITCGGTFDRARHEYLSRTIVRAVRVAS